MWQSAAFSADPFNTHVRQQTPLLGVLQPRRQLLATHHVSQTSAPAFRRWLLAILPWVLLGCVLLLAGKQLTGSAWRHSKSSRTDSSNSRVQSKPHIPVFGKPTFLLSGRKGGTRYKVPSSMRSAHIARTQEASGIKNNAAESAANNMQLCFVIRTYWGHGPSGSGSLQRMLAFLQASQHKRLATRILVMDKQPFEELAAMVEAIQNPQFSVYAEMIGEQFAAKQADGAWNPAYHDALYNLTDAAIADCPPDTRWVAITNGDNEYDPALIPALLAAPTEASIVALDYYSRYQRPTALPCERFAAEEGTAACKENHLRFCHTDLAANILDWPRFMREGRSFAQMPSLTLGLNDGLLAESLVAAGWLVHHIKDRCLLSHAPSPLLCALRDGMWDDSDFESFENGGGRCLTVKEGQAQLRLHPELQLIQVPLAGDGKSFGVSQLIEPLQLTCLRKPVGEEEWVSTFFPAACAAVADGGINRDGAVS